MNTKVITSSLVGASRVCPRMAWKMHNEEDRQAVKIDMSSQFLMDEASKVRKMALESFGLDVTKIAFQGWEGSASATLEALGRKESLVSGGVIAFNDVFVQMDCLKKAESGYEVVVFSSKARVSSKCLEKARLQFAALKSAGFDVAGVSVMHLNATGDGGLFSNVALNADDLCDVSVMADDMRKVVWSLSGDVPAGVQGEHCDDKGGCQFSEGCNRVVSQVNEDDIALLPSHAGPIKAAIAQGVKKIVDLPLTALKHKRNALMYASLKLNASVVSKEVRQKISALPFPRHLIDFESCAFAVPRFAGTRPHQTVCFQWSMHKQEVKNGSLKHSEFLDVSGSDPRRRFIESLLSELGDEGPVLVFSSFEKSRLKELAELFPDLAKKIEGVISRLFDVCPAVRQGYYNRRMRGKWGLKSIAPTLPICNDLLAYTDMDEVSDGLAAQAAYAKCIEGLLSPVEFEQLKNRMLKYCQTDTRGLAHLVDCLENSEALEVVSL